jgi:quercetin dioxygenase-like cupin family protein
MSDVKMPPLVVHPGDAPAQPVARARGARMAVLIGPSAGAENFITRRFLIESGGRIPTHRHDTIEHEQVVVRGEMAIGLDGVEHLVRSGDAILIPSGCVHWYENRGTAQVEFLCVVPNSATYATEWLEEPPPGAFLP